MPQNGYDITVAMLIINTLGIGVTGYLIKWWMDGVKKTKELAYQNKTDMQMHRKELDSRVDLMSKLVEKDIANLNKGLTELAGSIKELHENIRYKDQRLIDELKDFVKGRNNG